MGITHLSLYHFRNLEDGRVDFLSNSIIFRGSNGQGKTNCLEALYVLCYGGSFKTRTSTRLIRFGEIDAGLSGSFYLEEGLSSTVSIRFDKAKKEIKKDNKTIKDRKELIYNAPCILFSHEDISFIRGSQEEKRWFINQTLCLYDAGYLDGLRRYAQILKTRNKVLKENGKKELIEILTEQLVEQGLFIIKERETVTRKLSETLMIMKEQIGGLEAELKMVYHPSWNNIDREAILKKMADGYEKEKAFGMTLWGPHRDRFFFVSGNRDYSQSASTGQIRLLSLVLRATQAFFYHGITGRKPILLLDDVLLELDGKRRDCLLSNMPPYEQVFFTFLPEEKNCYTHGKSQEFLIDGGKITAK